MTIEELRNQVGKYVVLSLVTYVGISYREDFRKIREIRKLMDVQEDGEGKFNIVLGQGVVIDMSTKEFLAGTTSSDSQIQLPYQLIYRVASEDIAKLIEDHFLNQDYFINGAIV